MGFYREIYWNQKARAFSLEFELVCWTRNSPGVKVITTTPWYLFTADDIDIEIGGR